MKSKIYLMIAVCLACVVVVSSYIAVGQQQQQQPQPTPDKMKGMDMGEMNMRGDRVMGFDHDKTTHHFRLLPDGGFIQVEANDAPDIASRDQIRMHLSHIATMFADGNFKAPMLIHDQTPPGVPTMQRSKAKITYKFENTDQGGRVRISTRNAEALTAIHEFLRFQIKEHKTGDPLEVKEQS
jgi:hypothetical protein